MRVLTLASLLNQDLILNKLSSLFSGGMMMMMNSLLTRCIYFLLDNEKTSYSAYSFVLNDKFEDTSKVEFSSCKHYIMTTPSWRTNLFCCFCGNFAHFSFLLCVSCVFFSLRWLENWLKRKWIMWGIFKYKQIFHNKNNIILTNCSVLT